MRRRPVGLRRLRRSAGFSLLELLIVLVISVTALALAADLLREAAVRMDHATRQALDPVGETARRQLRADLRAAAGVAGAGFGWSYDALVLHGHPAGRIRYEVIGDELVREVDTASGPQRRPVLQHVSTFRWQTVGREVEVDLGFWRTARRGRLVAGGQREDPTPVEERHRFTTTPRSRERRSW